MKKLVGWLICCFLMACGGENEFVKLKTCFDANQLQGEERLNISWSTSSKDQPDSFDLLWDLSLTHDGCAESFQHVGRLSYYLGFWVELTEGSAADGIWLGPTFAPISAWVDDEPAVIGAHIQGCGFGIGEAESLSCSD